MGHNLSKPLSLKGFWALITIRHHYLLETLIIENTSELSLKLPSEI